MTQPLERKEQRLIFLNVPKWQEPSSCYKRVYSLSHKCLSLHCQRRETLPGINLSSASELNPRGNIFWSWRRWKPNSVRNKCYSTPLRWEGGLFLTFYPRVCCANVSSIVDLGRWIHAPCEVSEALVNTPSHPEVNWIKNESPLAVTVHSARTSILGVLHMWQWPWNSPIFLFMNKRRLCHP